MPNTTISVYLTDDDYVKYVKDKENINKIIRQKIREMLQE